MTLVLDGGLGTELERQGVNVSHELWSGLAIVENPQAIASVHKAYLESGADIITSATYQATVDGFLNCGIAHSIEEAQELIKSAVRLAKEVKEDVRPDAKVAASVGPYGAFLANGAEYTGQYGDIDENRLREFHLPRIEALLDAKPDYLAFETIPNIKEIKVITQLIDELDISIACWLSLSLNDPYHLADGTNLIELKSISLPHQIKYVGFNCIPLKIVNDTLKYFNNQKITNLPLIVYPNSGEVYDGLTKQWASESVQPVSSLAQQAPNWVSLGVKIIGGCCRTTPNDIKDLKEQLTHSV